MRYSRRELELVIRQERHQLIHERVELQSAIRANSKRIKEIEQRLAELDHAEEFL